MQQARVHVTLPKDSVFSDNQEPAKASVLVGLRPGTRLSAPNVIAITNLVSSAVEGLIPDAVSVVDMNGNLLSRPRRDGPLDGIATSEAALDYKQAFEHDLVMKINNTLEPLLGADKFRTGVSADMDMTSGEQSEETFDPSKSVMVSSQKTEDTSTASRVSPASRERPRICRISKPQRNQRRLPDRLRLQRPRSPEPRRLHPRRQRLRLPPHRRESAATPAAPTAAAKASPTKPAASPATSSCRKEP